MKKIFAIINGYGVPDNIFTDLSYHAYLIQTFNYLWTKYRNQSITIIPCGGKTDLKPPYQRTEASEMTKWLRQRLKQTKLFGKWKIKPWTTGLTALENMLATKHLIDNHRAIYFCEKTREEKMKILAKKIFGSKVTVMPIEFDGSPPRYDLPTRLKLEKEDLKYGLLALKDKKWRSLLKKAAEEKIRVLRKMPINLRKKEIDRIVLKIKREYYKKYNNNE